MRLPPPEVLASWPAPNYDDPHTQGPASVIVNVIFITLVVVTVGLRMYCRAFVRRWFGLDDVMILLAMVRPKCNGICLVSLLMQREGLRHRPRRHSHPGQRALWMGPARLGPPDTLDRGC